MGLSLRTKGVLALSALVLYLLGIGIFVAQERNKLMEIVNEIEGNNTKQAFLASLVNSLGHSMVETQAILSAAKHGGMHLTAGHPISRNLARIGADLAQLKPMFPSLKKDIDGFGEAIEQFGEREQTEVLTDLRDHEQRLIVELNDILAAMQVSNFDYVQRYHDTQQFINIVAIAGNVSAVLGSVAFILIFFTRLAKDIKLLQNRAVAVVAGYDGEALKRTRHDEIGALTDAVNRMQLDLRCWEQKQEMSRQQRFHQEKMAAVGSLAAAISHEVNNPITAISGVAQFIIAETKDATDSGRKAIHGFADQIWKHAERIASIMRRMSTLTMPRSPRCELIDLNELVESTCSFVVFDPRFSNIALDLGLDRNIPAVSAVADHVTQILMNLLINAADAADHSGKHGRARITVSTGSTLGEMRLSVSDNGMGMNAEVRARAFDDSFTTKPAGKGRGIGLFLCKTLVEDGGGRIELSSTPGVGTTVDLFLPLEDSGQHASGSD